MSGILASGRLLRFYDPTSIGGCVLWLRSDLGVTLNSSNVSAWADQSGQGNHAVQATALNQPAFVSNVINGYPSLRGDGTNYFMTCAAITTPFATCSIFSVHQFNNKTDVTIIELTPSGVVNTGVALFNSSNFIRSSRVGAGDSGAILIPDAVPTAWQYASNIIQSTRNDLWLNGGGLQSYVQTISLPSINQYSIFQLSGGFYIMDGDIAEIIIYNRVVSTVERQTVENYFQNRYGF